MKNLLRNSFFQKIVTSVFLLCYLNLTIAPAYAADSKRMQDARAVQEFYKNLPSVSADNNGNIQYGSGDPVNIQSIYPKDLNATASSSELESVYGKSEETGKLGIQTMKKLESEDSYHGMAFQTMKRSTQNKAKITKHDPVLRQRKEYVNNQKKYTDDLAKCSVTTTVNHGAVSRHIPDIKECTRSEMVHGVYNVTHPFKAGFLAYNSGVANIESCGQGCVNLWLGRVANNYLKGNCRIFENDMSVRVINPEALTDARIVQAKWDDYMQIYVGDMTVPVFVGPYGKDVFPPETPAPKDIPNFSHIYGMPLIPTPLHSNCELYRGWDVNPNIDVSEAFRDPDEGIVYFRQRISVGGLGDGFSKINIHYDPSKIVSNDKWIADDNDFYQVAAAIRDGYCTNYTATCNETEPVDRDGCALIDGSVVCESDLMPSPLPGISPFCRSVTLNAQCITDPGNMNSCGQFEDDESCSFVSSECFNEGSSHGCWQAAETWDCGFNTETSKTTTTESYDCKSTIACLEDGECLSPEKQQSGDFEQAAAMLQAATYALNNMNCGDPDDPDSDHTCRIFPGKSITCRTAMGGWQDCCNQPAGADWMEYVKLGAYILKGKDALSATGSMGMPGIVDMTTNALDVIAKPMMSAYNSLAGKAGAEISEKIVSEGISGMAEALMQQIMKQIAEWTYKIFGEGITNLLFQAGGTAVTDAGTTVATNAVQDGVMASTVQLSAALTSAITVVGWVYLAYQIANILVKIIWSCTDDEFMLSMKKETRLATKVGSWCAKKFLFCIEKRSSYCTYDSQVGRIIQEQGRPQLHKSWGGTKDPDCSGFTIEEFGRLDFSKIDLSEWIATMDKAGILPNNDNISLDNMTGKGSALNIDGQRQNSAERFQNGVDYIDVEGLKEKLENSIKVK